MSNDSLYIYIPDLLNPGSSPQQFEVLGSGSSHHWNRDDATHLITGSGILKVADHRCNRSASGCLYLHLVGKQYQFGPLLYEATGEKRCDVKAGESYLSYSCDEEMVVCRMHDFTLASPVVILRPVS